MLQNFDIYFPVQLWISRDDNSNNGSPMQQKYRLQPPLLGTKDEYRFHARFWDDLSNITDAEKQRLETNWKLHTTLWGFNGKYSPSLNRGFVTVAVLNNNTAYPLETEQVSVFRNGNSFYSSWETFTNSFGFTVYSYPVPGTRLLYVHNDQSTLRMIRLVFCDKDECPTLPEYPFLPNQDNKRVSCYDLFWNNLNLFFYVFPEKPRGQFFRLTETGFCVPSENSGDNKSMLECIQASVSMRLLPSNVFTGSSQPELQQVMYTYPVSPVSPYTTVRWMMATASIFCFLLSLILLFRVLRQK